MAKLPTSNCRAFTLATIILLFLLAACARDGRPTPQRLVDGTRSGATLTITATATATITPSSTPSPTSTNTPTPTPTPTATAPSALISGDLRASVLRAPEPQPGAVCGIVDVFDFPVDPPDALAVDRGGTDYNRYRERYNGFHAGEDWGGPNGRRLGSPVYSIGHGRVIYAHPYGWGVDQGTVIIRHVLDDGSQILSFYGHLDPPSVNLRYGECVARGDKIGEIGDPRGRPHLHFEIRNHMPAEPGPGYWSVDPTLAGWFPPSLTIWTSRIESSPGFLWSRPPAADDVFADIEASALLPNDVLVLLADGRLQGIGGGDGATRWIQPDPPTPTPEPDATLDPTRVAREVEAAAPVSAALDEEAPVLYAVDRRGRLQAYSTTDEAPAFEPLWQVELEISGPPALYPLPHGGVVTLGRGEMVALDVDGRQQWRQPLEQAPDDVVRTGDHLFLIEGGREPTLWSLTITGPTPLPGLPTGTPVAGAGSDLWLYSRDALYRLDPTMQKAELVMRLPTAFYGIAIHGNGDALALPDGGLLVAHQDLDDSRLLRFDGSGQLLWERSYRVAGDGGAQLTLLDGRVYLILIEEGATMTVTLLSVEMETGNLLRLFVGGTREGVPQDTWLFAGPAGTLFLNIGGGHLVALDPQQAVEALAPAP